MGATYREVSLGSDGNHRTSWIIFFGAVSGVIASIWTAIGRRPYARSSKSLAAASRSEPAAYHPEHRYDDLKRLFVVLARRLVKRHALLPLGRPAQ